MSEIFKPYNIKERLKPFLEEVNRNIKTISSDTIIYFGDIDKDLKPYILEIIIKYYPNFKINVVGNVDISSLNLKKIPVQFNIIIGSFFCGYNNLNSLENSPVYVKDIFDCSFNFLEDFSHGPKIVKGSFVGFGNMYLKSETGKPKGFKKYVLDFEDVFSTIN